MQKLQYNGDIDIPLKIRRDDTERWLSGRKQRFAQPPIAKLAEQKRFGEYP